MWDFRVKLVSMLVPTMTVVSRIPAANALYLLDGLVQFNAPA